MTTWDRFMKAIEDGDPAEALRISETELPPEQKPAAQTKLAETKQKKRKQRIEIAAVMAAVERDDCTGFCIACGEEQSGCEPDARRVECESCGEKKVYGTEELLFRIA
ncbi:MAG: hypothetical protein IT461_06485 [Planctomycetes bacterium]|nr:hypothetical protein [Planctomycetota bacterium]